MSQIHNSFVSSANKILHQIAHVIISLNVKFQPIIHFPNIFNVYFINYNYDCVTCICVYFIQNIYVIVVGLKLN